MHAQAQRGGDVDVTGRVECSHVWACILIFCGRFSQLFGRYSAPRPFCLYALLRPTSVRTLGPVREWVGEAERRLVWGRHALFVFHLLV